MRIKKIITTLLLSAILFVSQTSTAEGVTDKNSINEEKYVYLGGQTVGIAFYTDGLYITDTIAVESLNGEFINTAENAGLKRGDYIITANNIKMNDVSNLDAVLKASLGNKIKLEVKRENNKFITEITPIKNKEDNHYCLGLWLRDSVAGLGTITYIDPEDNSFGALGHSICDADTGKILSLSDGRIVECNVTGVKKGVKGEAGELKGSFGINARQLGEIEYNTKFGLIGKIYSTNNIELIKVCPREGASKGDAYIYSDFEDGQIKKYSIKILHINYQAAEKGLIIQITDRALIEKTGGIVQGLSGSPIVQNGRLVGAVTHVMLNDPTKGYGIFVDNMFENKT